MAVVYRGRGGGPRDACEPDKMNLASLGNMTPHVHWHVIPRFRDDRHFPGADLGGAEARGRRAAPSASSAPRGIAAALIARLGA